MAYSWKKVTKKLTADQRERGVVFSSVLIVKNHPEIESTLHEVTAYEEDWITKIDNLRDVSFFKNMARDFGYQVIEEIRK